MGSKICMNELCGATTSFEWKKGWVLKSGEFATLCQNCGSAYENLIFCETFHLDESGWRECKICEKHIHCGCVASKFLLEYLDCGGIGCMTCVQSLESRSARGLQIPSKNFDNRTSPLVGSGHTQHVENNSLSQKSNAVEGGEASELLWCQKDMAEVASVQVNREKLMLPVREVSTCIPNIIKKSSGSSTFCKLDKNNSKQGLKGTSDPALSFPDGVEIKEQNKGSTLQQGPRSPYVLPKPPKPAPSVNPETNRAMPPQTRVARPPAEGRGRNQLLPRYWPRITDQELQQICGDLNSTIEPLFEKVLSASDAGRIGRLVLPKACAETYFPPISQSEGIPIRIQDTKGKEWTFQFRFWPNNNSRMYVLEGVTPCIQNMQLEAGDTVTFSRIDPGGKLVMGFRKATNNNETQDSKTITHFNGGSAKTAFGGANGNLTVNGGRTSDYDVQHRMLVPAKKKIRNIGSKNKRLLIHGEDAMELNVNWIEVQYLLRPSPTARPQVCSIENCVIEAYDDPPIFGKKTIFTAGASGEQEQWAQCDNCSKWRRLPLHVLLSARWSCSDNIWDSSRCSCSAREDINQTQRDVLLSVGNDFKRRKITETKVGEGCEPSGLDALATAAALGEAIGGNIDDLGEASVATTTKHPRHRAGCTCIVCIQPPSGQGKHHPSCECNLCLTVRRRFKTKMLRKKRQSEHAQTNQIHPITESEMEVAAGQVLLQMNNYPEDDAASPNENQMDMAENGSGQLDLNCHPKRNDESLPAAAARSKATLMNVTNLPLEMYLKQDVFRSLGSCSLKQAAGDRDVFVPSEDNNTFTDLEMEDTVG